MGLTFDFLPKICHAEPVLGQQEQNENFNPAIPAKIRNGRSFFELMEIKLH